MGCGWAALGFVEFFAADFGFRVQEQIQ